MDFDDQLTGFASSGVVTSGGVISLGRRKYAVGLYWQPSPSGRVSQAAREAARQPGQMADFFAVRPGTQTGRVAQFGLGQKEYGHQAGLPTAAASIADEQPGSWGGVFKTPEGWWMVISRDDLIVPDGDVLYSDEQAARQRLNEEINLGGLQRIYAPDHWGMTGSDPMPLTLLMQGRADARLQNVSLPIRSYMIATGAILTLGVVGYLVFMWQQSHEAGIQESMAHLSAEQKAMVEMQKATQLAPPPPPPPPKRDWQQTPLPEIWLDACRQTLGDTPANYVGWKWQTVACEGETMTVSWARAAGPAVIPPGGSVANGNGTAVTSRNFVLLPPRGEQVLGNNGDFNKLILGKDLDVEIIPVAEEPPAPAAAGQTPAPPPPWLKKKITIKGHTAPWFIWQTYINVPGLIIERVTWQGTDWVTEGILYEMR